jgi:hypothetical protein
MINDSQITKEKMYLIPTLKLKITNMFVIKIKIV